MICKIFLQAYLFLFFGLYGVLGILNGNVTYNWKHPYVVAVECTDYFLCAGTIIGEQWVLYAGDCALECSVSDQTVLTQCEDGFRGTSWAVDKVIVHPKYGSRYLDYNYALVKIQKSFNWTEMVQKAQLPSRQLKAGTEAVIVGYGYPVSNDLCLRDAKIPIISRKECETYYKSAGISITERMGCVYSNGGATPCDEDFGDPVLVKKVVYHLVTYISEYNICSDDTIPAVTADVYPAVKWIKKVMKTE